MDWKKRRTFKDYSIIYREYQPEKPECETDLCDLFCSNNMEFEYDEGPHIILHEEDQMIGDNRCSPL